MNNINISDRYCNELKHIFDPESNIAIMGMGNPLLPKDSFGIVFVNLLSENINLPDNWLVLNCEMVPENFLGKVVKYNPDIVIFVDVVKDVKDSDDYLFILNNSQFIDHTFGTHKVAVSQLGEFISSQTGSNVYLLGFNLKYTPKTNFKEFYHKISKEIVNCII